MISTVTNRGQMRSNSIMNMFNGEFWNGLQFGEFNRLATLLLEKATIKTDSLELIIKAGAVKSIMEELNHEEN